VSPAEAPSEQLSASECYMFSYEPSDGESEAIGTWFPTDLDQRAGGAV